MAPAYIPDPGPQLLAEIRSAREALSRVEQELRELRNRPAAMLALGLGAACEDADLGAFARALYRARGVQAVAMQDWRYHEPAWDILLDLYASQAEGKEISVSSACIASRAPPTTGLRWVGRLEESDMIARQPCGHDKRRIVLVLTPRGHQLLTELLQRLASP